MNTTPTREPDRSSAKGSVKERTGSRRRPSPIDDLDRTLLPPEEGQRWSVRHRPAADTLSSIMPFATRDHISYMNSDGAWYRGRVIAVDAGEQRHLTQLTLQLDVPGGEVEVCQVDMFGPWGGANPRLRMQRDMHGVLPGGRSPPTSWDDEQRLERELAGGSGIAPLSLDMFEAKRRKEVARENKERRDVLAAERKWVGNWQLFTSYVRLRELLHTVRADQKDAVICRRLGPVEGGDQGVGGGGGEHKGYDEDDDDVNVPVTRVKIMLNLWQAKAAAERAHLEIEQDPELSTRLPLSFLLGEVGAEQLRAVRDAKARRDCKRVKEHTENPGAGTTAIGEYVPAPAPTCELLSVYCE
jgi:hypothetical protein